MTHLGGIARAPEGKRDGLRPFIDSGATYSFLPSPAWGALGPTPRRYLSFTLADGSTLVPRDSEFYLLPPQDKGHTPVVLGEPGDEAFLGPVTPKISRLVFSPFNRTHQSMWMLLT
jgi:hypothetical protein